MVEDKASSKGFEERVFMLVDEKTTKGYFEMKPI